jgi:hypothetical protein
VKNLLAHIIAWLNTPVNALGKILLAPIGILPGWMSNTIVSAVLGVGLLLVFKYTSNQRAIGRARDDIKAHLLALKLFKDSLSVTFQAQGRVLKGALLLLRHSIRPMLVMIVPLALLLGQLGLWYQFRPLKPGEQAVVTMKLGGEIGSHWPAVGIESIQGAEVITGPVRLLSKREICWKIKARENGYHRILFRVGNRRIEKEVAIGNGFMRISAMRPGWCWHSILLYPSEKPFGPDSIVRSIAIDYPGRLSRTSGANWWLVYLFIASLVFATLFKPFLKVRM